MTDDIVLHARTKALLRRSKMLEALDEIHEHFQLDFAGGEQISFGEIKAKLQKEVADLEEMTER